MTNDDGPDDGPMVCVGIPVTDMPIPPVESFRRNCRECEQEVWLSVRGSGPLIMGGADVVCFPCMDAAIKALGDDDLDLHTTIGSVSEAGLTPDIAKAIIRDHYNRPHMRVTVDGDTTKGVNDDDRD